jgi:malate dehydrogenase
MRTVAILGAGPIGAAAARAMAEREIARRIVLVDESEAVAAGKALDIAQSGPVDGWDTRLSGAAALGADSAPCLLVVADRHGAAGEWRGDAALETMRRVIAVTSCPMLFAGAAQHGLMADVARELGVPRNRLIGSAPEALASAARALTALAARMSASEVAVSVVGVPRRFVCAWNESRLGGTAATSVLGPPELAKLEAQVQASWPPGPYALGSAASAVASAILGGSPRTRTVFALIDGPLHGRSVVAAVPATFGCAGIASIRLPQLSPKEQLAFEGSLLA